MPHQEQHRQQNVTDMKKLVILIVVLVLASNFMSFPLVGKAYSFETIKCEFSYRIVPSKGTTLKHLEQKFQDFKLNSKEHSNATLYRTFKIEAWKFWLWRNYFTDKKWDYPYKKPCE